MNEILIEGMQFYAFHGCFKEENAVGNKFVIDIWINTDLSKASESDRLEDTVSYLSVYQKIKHEMEITSKLLEHVAQRIINNLFTNFLSIVDIKIKITKINPPLGGEIDKVSVILKKTKE